MFSRKLKSAAGVAAVTMVSFASVAAAAVNHVDGGTWNHGRNSDRVWSNYHHPARTHKASVTNGDGNLQSSGWVAPGKWANSSTYATWRGNKSFYDVK